jgi:ATP-dependent DNA ligase
MPTPKNQQQVEEFANLATIVNGELSLPILYTLDTHNKYRLWQIFIGIANPKTNKHIPVTQEYIERKKLAAGYQGYYYTISGQEDTEKPIKSERTYIETGKGEARSNYTTPFTQAVLDARTDYNKKTRKGAQTDKSYLLAKDAVLSIPALMKMKNRGSKPWRVFAQATHDINKSKNKDKIVYPASIDPKYDGTLYMVVYHPDLPENPLIDNEHIDGYSRGREEYEGQDHVLRAALPVLKKHPGVHLVGELWKEGKSLQDISGSSRRDIDSSIKTESLKLDYNVFDMFDLEHPELTYEERKAMLDDIFDEFNEIGGTGKHNYIVRVPNYEVKNYDEVLVLYRSFLDKGLEGAVIRNNNGIYEFSPDKEQRSYNQLKLKPRPDGEWPIVGFTDGTGKEKGAIKWICAARDLQSKLPLEKRKTFNVTPNMPTKLRKFIFKKLQDDDEFSKFKGKLATISYSVLSKTGNPQQPKFLRFRDQALQAELIKGYTAGSDESDEPEPEQEDQNEEDENQEQDNEDE